MPGLAFPLGLAALLALAVPLLVHLARRNPGTELEFAALRWLTPRPRPQARRRFEERPLLLARLLLLALLALWLAEPLWRGWIDRRPVVAVVPGADPVEARALVAGEAGARALWLAPGFPDFGEEVPAAGPVASLMRELDAGLAPGVALTLLVPERLGGLDGGAIRLSREVQWRTLAGGMPAGPVPAPPRWTVHHAPARAGDVRWFRAAAAALERGFVVAETGAETGPATGAALPAVPGPLIRLDDGPLPAAVLQWVERGGVLLVAGAGDGVPLWRDEAGVVLALGQARGRGRLVRLVPPLTPASLPALVEPDFPERLAALLEERPAPERAMAALLAPASGGPAPVLPALDLRPWLAVLIGLVLLVERWLATAAARGLRP
jgi:hypothetical protein